jgi:hypothetical protein
MDVKDLIVLSENKVKLLLTMKHWFKECELENSYGNPGTYLMWGTYLGSSTMESTMSTTTIVAYIDWVIDKGWYSDIESKETLNWMRELYIVNGMGYTTISPITTI